jgi:hypothetical protein
MLDNQQLPGQASAGCKQGAAQHIAQTRHRLLTQHAMFASSKASRGVLHYRGPAAATYCQQSRRGSSSTRPAWRPAAGCKAPGRRTCGSTPGLWAARRGAGREQRQQQQKRQCLVDAKSKQNLSKATTSACQTGRGWRAGTCGTDAVSRVRPGCTLPFLVLLRCDAMSLADSAVCGANVRMRQAAGSLDTAKHCCA